MVFVGGCSRSSNADQVPPGGALGWIPADAVTVMTADISPSRLDTVFTMVEQVPAWSLLESRAPASDGSSARLAILRAALNVTNLDDSSVSDEELDSVLGSQLGGALLTLPTKGAGERYIYWIDVLDEDGARDLMKKLTKDMPSARDHYVLRDDLLMVSSSKAALEKVLSVRKSGDAPWLKHKNVKALQRKMPDDALLRMITQGSSHHEKWMAVSFSASRSGLHMSGVWTHPNERPSSKVDARELVERQSSGIALAAAGPWPSVGALNVLNDKGLTISLPENASNLSMKVSPKSSIGRKLEKVEKTSLASLFFRSLGLDLTQLNTKKGLLIPVKRSEDLAAFALGGVKPALPTSTIDQDAAYQNALKTLDLPTNVNTFGWLDFTKFGAAAIKEITRSKPALALFAPSLIESLDSTPGVVWWTSTDTSGTIPVGHLEVAIPVIA